VAVWSSPQGSLNKVMSGQLFEGFVMKLMK